MVIVVAITGASGSIIAKRLLEALKDHEVHLIVSASARRVIAHELGYVPLPATVEYRDDDIGARPASSSFLFDAMVVVPCSMKTLSAIATGYADNLVTRAADNALRCGRRLVVVPRETPLSLAAIENMRHVKLAGGIVLPPSAAYYFEPRTLDDMTNFFVGKIMDTLGIPNALYSHWRGLGIQECEAIEEGL